MKHLLALAILLSSIAVSAKNNIQASYPETDNIATGFYYIVSAGNGPGYSGGPYNYENKVAMFNKDNLVQWELFDTNKNKFIYQFIADPKNEGSYFLKNIADNSYIGNNYETGGGYNGGIYSGQVASTPKPETSLTFTTVTPGKYFVAFTGNKYALSMDNSHNGSSKDSGILGVWGSITSAQKYGINVWYVQPVPQSIIDNLEIPIDTGDVIVDPDTTTIFINVDGIPGKLISTDAYSSGTKAINAFDNDLSTSFKASSNSTGWIGLDLGEKYVINKVGYAPEHGCEDYMLLGVFEGANNPDFSDAIPFHIIKDTPSSELINYDEVNCSRGFRYVRYKGPEKYLKTKKVSYTNSLVAELRFYGEPGEGDDSHLYQFTNLPLVVIHTDADIADIAASQKDLWRTGYATFISKDGTSVKDDTMSIKGRGNGSWSLVSSDNAKRPYKIKLDSKKKLFDMPAKAKKWTLIANWGDKTILRNNVAFSISKIFEMDYTPAIQQVDVVFNGQYKGNYQLCDQIEVHKNRVALTEMDTDDNAGDSLTGGYLIELDYYAGSEPKMFRSTTYNIPVTVHYPEDDKITNEQFQYIQNQFNQLCSRVNSNTFKDPFVGYEPMLAIDTWLKYFLIEELCGNPDAYFSMYLTKDRGKDSKFRVSPVWDFDLAFDNDQRFHSIINKDYLCFSSSTYSAGSLKTMNQKLVNANKALLSEIWSWYRYEGGLTHDDLHELVDSLYELNCESAEYNYMRWDILNLRTQQQYTTRGSYKSEVNFIYDYLSDRIFWMDNKIGLKEPIGIHSTTDAQPQGGIHGLKGYIQLRGFAEGSKVKIYNTNAMLVNSSEIYEFDNRIELPKGIYIVKITDKNGATTTQKVAVE